MSSISRLFSQQIGIDLGSSMIRIWTPSEGVLLREPAFLAVETVSKKVVAVGAEAAAMRGRVLKGVVVLQPIKEGMVYDFHSAQALLRIYLQRVTSKVPFASKKIMASVPANKTEVSQQILSDLLYSVGASEVYTVSQPLAASIGAGVPIADASGTILLQLGSGVVEAAVISLGSMIASATTYKAGDYFTERLQYELRRKKEFTVAFETAEKLKRSLVSLDKSVQKNLLVAGKDSIKGNPREIKVNTQDLAAQTLKVFDEYEYLIKDMLTTIPPELTVDIVDKGILVSGGGADLDGLSQHLTDRLGVPVSIVDDPAEAVIKGIGTALENLDEFKQSLGYSR
ncbi:MAG: hypothetical protein CO156_02840 [Candidatus Pacebacteria bacterium CG_4_9_14_3_um_filter_40_12]|nr:hypothetical protein [Candidatus Paceibacterota bacterium]PIR63564.1 MAG: hypothetical protein COU64_03860 [Candidatus Pacebacteria bacterium CG10_big_fil_rev_8_21_14_0_10_40_26]PIZ79221.1 MAG: hypothetical protein COY01_02235 [Candidatus Pacebacteria bacterium CG_4_10_14_0_2_um_filter_40_20]PJA68876.1 MAG: hypothetical protein CO156_02840 [Candidatus Pacebacteria bacterium CG_4_9_14_3_um_filter_40_12]PJC42188.1 MAG: hypothetical protein CO041_00945 [Candidatus Pacebacteria bacterium CG_4_9_